MKIHLLISCAIYFFLLSIVSITFAQSPYKTSWTKEGIIFGSGITSALVASSLEEAIVPLTAQEINDLSRNDVNWFDKSATYNWSKDAQRMSDIFVGACLLSPLSLFTSKKINGDFGTVSIMYMETLLFAAFVPSFGKGGVQRIRPFVYNENAPFEEKITAEAKKSFFSRHTTCAFSSAVFFATVYSDYFPNSKWKPHVWSGSVLAASIVGYMRYEGGVHFPTDVLVGAAVGSAIGYLIPYLHRRDNANYWSVVPTYDMERFRLSVNYRF